MPVALTTPIVTTAGYVSARRLQVQSLSDATPVAASLIYGTCDAQGRPVGDDQAVDLGPVDLLAFAQALAGGFRKAMNAALLSAVPTLAGTST